MDKDQIENAEKFKGEFRLKNLNPFIKFEEKGKKKNIAIYKDFPINTIYYLH